MAPRAAWLVYSGKGAGRIPVPLCPIAVVLNRVPAEIASGEIAVVSSIAPRRGRGATWYGLRHCGE